MNKIVRQSYHLYHHQPDPLSLDTLTEQAWLVNNGVKYRIVATIQARTPEEAFQAMQEKTTGHGRLTRFVELQAGNHIRTTLPGDVLIGNEDAWMLLPEAQIRHLPYTLNSPWKAYKHDAPVHSVNWSPNGAYVVAGGSEVRIHALSGDNPRQYTTSYRRHGNWTIYAVAWSPDGQRIASGGYEGEVHVWKTHPSGGYAKAAAGSIVICRTEEAESKQSKITCITWASDSRSLLAGRDTGEIVQWEATTGECLRIIHRHQEEVRKLVYSPDGTRLASASEDRTVRIWDINEDPDQDIICRHTDPVSSCAWSPDGTLIVSTCEKEDQSLHFWDPLTGEPGEQIPLSVYTTKPMRIRTVVWSPDGKFVAAGCDDGNIQVVDVARRRHVFTYRAGNTQKVHTLAWSPDGTSLASGGSNQWGRDDYVQIWQISTDLDAQALR